MGERLFFGPSTGVCLARAVEWSAARDRPGRASFLPVKRIKVRALVLAVISAAVITLGVLTMNTQGSTVRYQVTAPASSAP